MTPQRMIYMVVIVVALAATLVWYRRSTATELPDGRRIARPGRKAFDQEYVRWQQ